MEGAWGRGEWCNGKHLLYGNQLLHIIRILKICCTMNVQQLVAIQQMLAITISNEVTSMCSMWVCSICESTIDGLIGGSICDNPGRAEPENKTISICMWQKLERSLCIYTCTVFLSFREGRLRHYLGVRYDARSGVFDWDYNMKLTEMVRLAHHAVVSSGSTSIPTHITVPVFYNSKCG